MSLKNEAPRGGDRKGADIGSISNDVPKIKKTQDWSQQYSALPPELKSLKAWLLWKYEQKPGEAKPRKIPVYVNGSWRRKHGTPEDLAQLATFEDAQRVLQAAGNTYAGLGLATLPQWGIVALDFDNCIIDGRVMPEVERLIAGTYCETSPSGKGVRAIMRGELRNHKSPSTEAQFGFETFHSKGFVTITGKRLEICDFLGGDVVNISPEVLDFCKERFGDEVPAASPTPSGITSGDINIARLESMADHIDPDAGYSEWLQFGMALHHATDGSEEGYALFDARSAVGTKYQGPEDTRLKWDSFGRQGSGCAAVTVRTLEKMARDGGWVEDVSGDFDDLGTGDTGETPETGLSFVDFSSLAHTFPSAREAIVPEWIFRGVVTLLAGAGGVGKSLLAQMLATSVANGAVFLGMPTIKGAALGFFCEDDGDELLRRGASIFAVNFLDPATSSENLYLDARAGKPNTLAAFKEHRIAPTDFMRQIQQQCEKLCPALLILDNIAQMFAGVEFDRSQVTAFCNLLTGIAQKHNCAVLLLGHPAKAEGSEYSGSTAWEAAVRTRIFLSRNDDGTLSLRKAKANYAALEAITIEYKNGVFVRHMIGDEPPEAIETAKQAILKALDSYTGRQEHCSHLSTARNYIVRKIKKDDLLGETSERLAERALHLLIESGDLIPNSKLPWKSASRHPVQGLVKKAEINACD